LAAASGEKVRLTLPNQVERYISQYLQQICNQVMEVNMYLRQYHLQQLPNQIMQVKTSIDTGDYDGATAGTRQLSGRVDDAHVFELSHHTHCTK
jgi:hypothetical protein